MNSVVVPVIGMHRSGTSAIAGALHKGGVLMGSERHFKPPPSRQNPKGFFEDFRFRRLNDRLLERNGYVVKSWEVDIPQFADDGRIRRSRRRLIGRCQRSAGAWGWKDPRTCLVLDLWLSDLEAAGLLPQTRVLFVHRHPAAVADSLRRRDWLGMDVGLRLWTRYTTRSLAAIETFGVPVHYLGYEGVLADPGRTLDEVGEFLEGAFDPSAGRTFIDPGLERSGISSGGKEAEVEGVEAEEALALYESLKLR